MAAFSWLSWGQAQTELSTRLSDPEQVLWSAAELQLYLTYAMRIFSAYTQYWLADYAFDVTPPFATNWFQANGTGSPRQQTQTDVSLYTLMEYMLMEPATGGTWTGTNQFSIAALAQAVQGRRDESLQIGATNLTEITLPVTPGTNSVQLPDTTLDVLRVRYVPASGLGSPYVLQRGDKESFRVFTPSYLQTVGTPMRWDIITGPPLVLSLDTMTPVPATLQILILQAEAVPDPPSSTPLGIPDDWSWVPLFGALADVLSAQEEAKDAQRADYCRKRYLEGLSMLKNAPWLLKARITGVAVDTPSFASADRFSVGWQTDSAAFPQIIVAGVDLYAVSPVPTVATSVLLVVAANAPIPTSDAAFIQVPRDIMDALLDEAQHIAAFKLGGAEFAATMELHQSFLGTVERYNSRIRASGIFPTTLRPPSPKVESQQPRFDVPSGG